MLRFGSRFRRTGFEGFARFYAFKTRQTDETGPGSKGASAMVLLFCGMPSVLQALAVSGFGLWFCLRKGLQPVRLLSVHRIDRGSGQLTTPCTYQAPTKDSSLSQRQREQRGYKCQPS